MAAQLTSPTEGIFDAAGISVEERRGGKGQPVLVIHGELGVPGWLEAHQRLSETFEVIVPSLPGFGKSTRPDWIMSVRDLAAWITWFARDRHIKEPVHIIGLSLGGWVAAEIATIAPQFIRKLVLVGPMGVKPESGQIFDYFLDSGMTGLRRAFRNPDATAEFLRFYGEQMTAADAEQIEQHREMTCRIAWKPYMHSLTLPHLLAGVKTPTMIVMGQEDEVTPLNCGQIYQRAIPGSRLTLVEQCGHMPEMERPAEFVSIVRKYFLED